MYSTDQNPFQPPSSNPTGLPESRENVRTVAHSQRLVNIAILLCLCYTPLNALTSPSINPVMSESNLPRIVLCIGVCLLAFKIVAAWRLAYSLLGTGKTAAHCIAMLIPFVGLILLVLLSVKANRYFKDQGLRIGFFGVELKAHNRG
jgi:hypothetical protein